MQGESMSRSVQYINNIPCYHQVAFKIVLLLTSVLCITNSPISKSVVLNTESLGRIGCRDLEDRPRSIYEWFPQENCTLNCTCGVRGELLCRPLCQTANIVCNNAEAYVNRVVYGEKIKNSTCRICRHEICDAIGMGYKAFKEDNQEETDSSYNLGNGQDSDNENNYVDLSEEANGVSFT